MVDSFLITRADELILLARLLLAALFVLTGWQKMTGFAGTVNYMASVGAPAPQLAAVVSIVMELFVGLALMLGIATRPLALLLALFTLSTALIGHHYWTMQGPVRHDNQLNFFKNMCIMGGLLLLAVTGAGRYSVL